MDADSVAGTYVGANAFFEGVLSTLTIWSDQILVNA